MDVLNYYLIIIILILIVWIIIGMLWQLVRKFFHNNYSFFDASFVIAYFVEQFILILLLYYIPEKAPFWVGLFALIVVTTASLQKLTMDSKDKKLGELYAVSNYLRQEVEEYNEELLKENEELKQNQEKIINYFKERTKN